MPPNQHNYHAFVIRIWQEEDIVQNDIVWYGWVQQIGTEANIYFRDLMELLAFVEECTIGDNS